MGVLKETKTKIASFSVGSGDNLGDYNPSLVCSSDLVSDFCSSPSFSSSISSLSVPASSSSSSLYVPISSSSSTSYSSSSLTSSS